MLKEIKGKAKEAAVEVKDWANEHKGNLIVCGVGAGIIITGIVLGRKYDKKFELAWRAAKQAYDNGELDHDFGPYKLMKFFEPKTGEFIGETLCHKDTVEAFLNVK